MGNLLRNIQLTGAVIIMITTIVAFGLEVKKMIVTQDVFLADILLLFIYLEVLGMVTSYWGTQRIRLTYPLFIAITAIGRLIILQKKDIDAISLIYESSAILLIAIAIVVLRFRKSKKLEVTLHKDDL
ncbi:phosphate-starvation-inducible PsiE family protein [Pelagibacteraceae bacterium]|jgi:protein PsiE|nr:phosphate-starvation-inducible PsiE family protein [Pelagibacteraceae bacterium]NCV23761.1 phosphate starvation-inducible protein PhoH [Pseudomonadota bacterium]